MRDKIKAIFSTKRNQTAALAVLTTAAFLAAVWSFLWFGLLAGIFLLMAILVFLFPLP